MASNQRKIQDALLAKSVALPNAANTVNTISIDLGHAKPFPTSERFNVNLRTTSGVGANNKNITIVLQGSNEASANFTNIAGLAPLVIPEVSTAYAATTRASKLPPAFAQRYIRASATGEANGGNASNGTVTVELLF
jgi:hypothetical protein